MHINKTTAALLPFAAALLLYIATWCSPKKNSLQIAYPEPAHNISTEAGIALGRMLFYDTRLSGNNRVACATCHQQALAFSDGQALSTLGVSGQALNRHTPSIVNTAWMEGLFWDGGVKNLESLVFAPLNHPDEMAQSLKELPAKLSGIQGYPKAFYEAFGTDSITLALVARALAQFQRSIISDNSYYDQAKRGASGYVFSEEITQGEQVFLKHCAACHVPPLFTDNRYHNNGLDSIFNATGEALGAGRYRISNDSLDLGKFKTPTLRNIMVTAPYMHDGRFAHIEQVLEHYEKGIKASATLSPLLPDKGLGIQMGKAEKKALIRFLHTLTDSTLLTNEALKPPLLP